MEDLRADLCLHSLFMSSVEAILLNCLTPKMKAEWCFETWINIYKSTRR